MFNKLREREREREREQNVVDFGGFTKTSLIVDKGENY